MLSSNMTKNFNLFYFRMEANKGEDQGETLNQNMPSLRTPEETNDRNEHQNNQSENKDTIEEIDELVAQHQTKHETPFVSYL